MRLGTAERRLGPHRAAAVAGAPLLKEDASAQDSNPSLRDLNQPEAGLNWEQDHCEGREPGTASAKSLIFAAQVA